MEHLNIQMKDSVFVGVYYDCDYKEGCETCDYGSKYYDNFTLYFVVNGLDVEVDISCSQMYWYGITVDFMMVYLLNNLEHLKTLEFSEMTSKIKQDMKEHNENIEVEVRY